MRLSQQNLITHFQRSQSGEKKIHLTSEDEKDVEIDSWLLWLLVYPAVCVLNAKLQIKTQNSPSSPH